MKQIPENQRFKLYKPTYDSGAPIVQAYVVKTNGSVITLRPLKFKEQVVDTQDVSVSPFLVSNLASRGTIVYFDKDGNATEYGLPPAPLQQRSLSRFE